jgi:UDP-N-acetylglucosamine 4-epimerase
LDPRYPYLKGRRLGYRDFRAGDARHSLADISKAHRLLGCEPTLRLREGLVEVMDWRKRFA